MTSFATVGEFDLRTPLTVRETGTVTGPSTNPSDLVVQGRQYVEGEPRSWDLDIPDEHTVARDRALTLFTDTGFGALPLRWTPPNESEIHVFINLPGGMQTTRTAPQHHSLRVTLTESK